MIYNGKFKVTSIFGQRVLNGVKENHKGIDVVGLDNKNVRAVKSGKVLLSRIITDKSNRTWQWGNYVCILGDDGRQYYYCHLSKRLVKAGQRVNAGDNIGIEGNTGYSFGSHCHFEVRTSNGQSIDPAPFLGITNKVGTYTKSNYSAVEIESAKKTVQTKAGLSDQTIKYLMDYKYGNDLIIKLAKAMK